MAELPSPLIRQPRAAPAKPIDKGLRYSLIPASRFSGRKAMKRRRVPEDDVLSLASGTRGRACTAPRTFNED